MFIMVAGRAQGKSVTAVRWLLEQPGHRMLIVANPDRKGHLLHIAGAMLPASIPTQAYIPRYISPNIVIADRFERMQHVSRGREIGIDDAEEVLKIMFGGRVEFAAFNATLVPTASTPPRFMRADQPYPQTVRRLATAEERMGIRPHRYPRTQEEHDEKRRLAIESSPTIDAEVFDDDAR